MEKHRVNVRTLAEFALEGGDLCAVAGAAERMQEGIRGHKRLQSAYAGGLVSEAPVSLEASAFGLEFVIQGRVDGLDERAVPPVVEEIKVTRLDPAAVGEGNPVHWAQAEIYAHMVARRTGAPRVRVRLVYAGLDGSRAALERLYDAARLLELFDGYLLPYAQWVARLDGWQQRSRPTMRALNFTFDSYRAGQREMAVNGYVALRERANLLCQAPTGIGKTAAALFPAVKAMGEGLVKCAFYLTARGTNVRAALTELDRMREKGLVARSVVITAKEKCCACPGVECGPEECERARGYFDRRRGALTEALSLERLDAPAIRALADEHEMCPFELSLDLSEMADVILCDYNYAFDPVVKLKRFFLEKGDYALLIDEAHNLPVRAREMLSAELRGPAFSALRREVGQLEGKGHPLYKALTALLKALRALREDAPCAREEPPVALAEPLDGFVLIAKDLLDQPRPYAAALRERYFDALAYQRVSGEFGEAHRALIAPEGKTAAVKLWRYDPSAYLKKCFARVRGSILFSATLSPLPHYMAELGLSEEDGDAALDLPSPFPGENLLVLQLPLNTRYRQREESAGQVARAIAALCRARTGNYLACFPSYAYLKLVLERFRETGAALAMVQAPGMDERERARFLEAFSQPCGQSRAAFVAMGGVFAEGIDLPGELLLGAAIVGVGMPQPSLEREVMAELLDDGEGGGRRAAYTYPGMERVLQAAGRVIRAESDRGVVLLLDDRFAQEEYRELLPEHWRMRPEPDIPSAERAMRRFWAEGDGRT